MSETVFSPGARGLGVAAAAAVVVLSIGYSTVLTAGLLALRSPLDPIGEPYFSLLELLILALAPLMVVLMAVLHAWAPPSQRVFSLLAVLFMAILATLTCTVHFVILTVGRSVGSNGMPWLPRFFSWTWPSVVYATNILAWDLFFALSVLFAAPLFAGDRLRLAIRMLLVASGVLALAGLVGVPLGDMQVRMIGVVGYAVVFPFAAALLGMLFRRSVPVVTSARPRTGILPRAVS